MSFGAAPVASWSSAWAPRTRLTISEWADRERVLPETSAARGARWKTATVPYLAAVMDSLHEPGVRKVALAKASQAGGTEAVMNAIGFYISHDPAPMLFVAPTFQDVERLSKGRLADMIRTTPALRSAVHDRRLPARGDGRSESTVLLKQFAGGFLALGGSNTPNTFAALSVRTAFGDDVDRWPMLDEGDPQDLLCNRVRTFHDGRVVFVSTPTMKGSRIDTLFARSDQRRYLLTCPRCGREDWTTWSDKARFRVVYTDKRPESARLECPGCGAQHDEAERRRMVAKGRWLAQREADELGLVAFHLPAMISTLGSVTLPDLVSGWLSARERGTEGLRTFVNTSLAEPWIEEDRSIRLQPEGGFMSQREDYDVVPMAASLITGAADIQDDRFELLFCAWGPRDEMWVLDHHVFSKDDSDPERRFDPYDAKDWERLYRSLYGTPGLLFEHESGGRIPVSTLAVDSGFQTPLAYRFSRFNRRAIFATKGVAELQDGHLIKFSEDKESAGRRGVNLVLVNTGGCKQRLADRIKDGRLHFPRADWCNEEFFAQLCAEEATPIFNPAGVRVGQKWVKTRPRNEVLDLLVLNLAARQIRGTLDLEAYRRSLGLPAA
jgi:phage terminase large subunit GpA-like protein